MRSVSLTYVYIITDISLFYKGVCRNLKIFHLFYKIILYNKSKFYSWTIAVTNCIKVVQTI